MHERAVTVHITAGNVVKSVLVLSLFGLLWYLRDIVLIVLTAIVIASAIEPGVRWFMRRGFGRILSAITVYVGILGVFFGVLFFFIPPILNDAANFLQQLPSTLSNINFNDLTHGLLPGSVTDQLNSADILRNISATLESSTGGVFSTLSAFFGGLTSFILIVVFSFYFSVQDTGIDDFLRIVTPIGQQEYVLSLWRRSQEKIGKWMQGQLVLALLVGVLLYLGLVILGVPHPLLLAVLAAVFELIPVFGQMLAMIPAMAVSFMEGGVTMVLLVAGLYLIVQQFEAHLIYPLVVKKVIGIPPLLVILALLVGFKLIGFLGVLLSVPIAGAIQEFVSDIDKKKTEALARRGLTPEGVAQ